MRPRERDALPKLFDPVLHVDELHRPGARGRPIEDEEDAAVVRRDFVNRMACWLPASCWTSVRVLGAMKMVAGLALGAGRVCVSGLTPGGNRFLANPRVVWAVIASRATVAGRDLGAVGPIVPQPARGDVRIPRRGLFAFGSAFMLTPPSPGRFSNPL